MNNDHWLKLNGTIALDFFDAAPVKIKTKLGETKGVLTVDGKNAKEHQVKISASYNSSPFQNTVSLKKFYLIQAQLDLLQENGAACILDAP